jgi:hypothetical protein
MDESITLKEIEEAISFHEQKAFELKSVLQVLRNFSSYKPFDATENKASAINHQKFFGGDVTLKKIAFPETIIPSKTFKETILEILRMRKKPLTGRSIYNSYRTHTSRDIEYNSFSAQLSNVVGSKAIMKHTFADNSIESKYYYGLPEWFNKDELTREMQDEIKKPD